MRHSFYSTLLITCSFLLCASCSSDRDTAGTAGEREGRLDMTHCFTVQQYAVLENGVDGETELSFYNQMKDTLRDVYFEQHVRSVMPEDQVYILGYVELSDFSRAGQGIYYVDPDDGPVLLEYNDARIIKRLKTGDSPWTLANDLNNPLLADLITGGTFQSGRDFLIDVDILVAVQYWGQAFSLPNEEYRIRGRRIQRVVVRGAAVEEGKRDHERFLYQYAEMKADSSGPEAVTFFSVFKDTLTGERRFHWLKSVQPEHQIVVIGYERTPPELRATGKGIYVRDQNGAGTFVAYDGARILKKVRRGDSQWKIARDLGNTALVNKMPQGIIHPGDMLIVDADLLTLFGGERRSFDLPDNSYTVVGDTLSSIIVKEADPL